MQLPVLMDIVGKFLIATGLFLTILQLRVNHQRSSREKAVDYLLGWARNIDRRASLARKVAETFSREECISVENQNEFTVSEKIAPLMFGLFDSDPVLENGRYKIDVARSAELRWLLVSYLNNLEAILSGWRHYVGDREIIAEQFKPLVSPENGRYILETFRNALESGSFPSIEQFVSEIKNKHISIVRPPFPQVILRQSVSRRI